MGQAERIVTFGVGEIDFSKVICQIDKKPFQFGVGEIDFSRITCQIDKKPFRKEHILIQSSLEFCRLAQVVTSSIS